MKTDLLKTDERLDDLQLNCLKIIQNKKLYCFTSDAVLLANFVKARKTDKVLDLCSGSGIVGILVNEKNKPNHTTLLEIQPELVDMAKRSVELNELQNQISVVNLSVQEASKKVEMQEKFSVVCCNPPYKKIDGHKLSNNNSIDMCKYELTLKLDELFNCTSKLLKYGGKFYFVHESSRLTEIVETLKKHNLEPKKIQFVYPKKNANSNVVLISATKHGKSGVLICPPKILN